jgi:DNA-binding transcriptional LysR family regulator
MSVELPDLRQIRAFVAVAETGSFTKAADRLFLTQSSVSHSLRGLEEQLETKLVDRLGKRVCLTQDGTIFLRRCRRVLAELEAAARELEALKHWGQGRIRIGATHSLCQYLLPTALREFREGFPRCEILIESADTTHLIGMLDAAKLDLVLGLRTHVPPWCRFEDMFEDELVCVVSPRHPWAQTGHVPADELAGETLLVYARNSETYRLVREHFEGTGLRLRAPLNLGSMEAIKEMAKIGIGVGIVAPWVAQRELESGELVGCRLTEDPPRRTWGLFRHDAKKLSAVEDAFVGICGETMRGLAGEQRGFSAA